MTPKVARDFESELRNGIDRFGFQRCAESGEVAMACAIRRLDIVSDRPERADHVRKP